MKNERTSARVAKIAATVLRIDGVTMNVFDADGWNVNGIVDLEWRDIRALAASALTQAPDKALPADPPYAADYKPRTRKWRKTDPHVLYVETHVGKPKRKARRKAKR